MDRVAVTSEEAGVHPHTRDALRSGSFRRAYVWRTSSEGTKRCLCLSDGRRTLAIREDGVLVRWATEEWPEAQEFR
jgi:hypothetical protein